MEGNARVIVSPTPNINDITPGCFDLMYVPLIAFKSICVTVLVQEEQTLIFPQISLGGPSLIFIVSSPHVDNLHDTMR